MNQDRHKTAGISKWLALIVSAFFAAIGVAGYQRTDDPRQLLLFLALALLAYGVVKLAFFGINWLLDSIDQR